MKDSIPELPPANLDPQRDLVGCVFDVPDSLWQIDTSAQQHPGACTHYLPARHSGILLQGTDAENVSDEHAWRYQRIEPDENNGLKTSTVFRLTPRFFRRHRLRLLHAGRIRGRLSSTDLETLRQRLRQLHGI